MAVNQRFTAKKSIKSYVDISKFTNMEVEHQNDTNNMYAHINDGHVHPDTIKSFSKNSDKSF